MDRAHNLDSFNSGDEKLDNWLTQSASSSQAEGFCAVHVCVRDASDVRGFFSLGFTYLRPVQLPQGGNTRRDTTPVVVLGKLALHSELQGTGASTLLLYEAMRKSVAAADAAGGTYLIVDVPNVLRRPFYARHGFVPVGSSSARMYMKLSSVRAATHELDS